MLQNEANRELIGMYIVVFNWNIVALPHNDAKFGLHDFATMRRGCFVGLLQRKDVTGSPRGRSECQYQACLLVFRGIDSEFF